MTKITFFAGIGAVAIAVAAWPASWPGDGLIGAPTGEADNHLWMLWVATRRLFGDERVLANAPAGVDLPLMDRVNLPIFAALHAILGPIWAWNGLALWNLALAAFGGWLLAREVAGSRAALVGLVGAATAPSLIAAVDFGVSEAWPVGWLALHVAFLLRHGRTGRRREAVAAGLTLGAAALAGWYLAFFALVAEAVLVPLLWWRHRRWETVAQGLIALAMVLPAFVEFAAKRGLWEGRWRPPPPGPLPMREDWMSMPVYGTDMLNPFLPRWEVALGGGDLESKSVYLGVALIALAALGAWKRWREVGPLLIVAAVLLVLAVGYWPTAAGRALGVPGPAYALVQLVPDLRGISHWQRAAIAAAPFVAAAAAAGVEALGARWSLPLAALVLADGVLFAGTKWPRQAYRPDVPPALMELARTGDGGVIQLPFDNGRVPFSTEPARLYNRWQVFHGLPVSENYEGVDSLLEKSDLVSGYDRACGVEPTVPWGPRRAPRRLSTVDSDPFEPEVRKLRDWGYRWIVLHVPRARDPESARRLIEAELGAGESSSGAVVWDLER